MSLASQLIATKSAVRDALPPHTFSAIERSIEEVRESGLAIRAAGVGDLVALPVLESVEGKPVDLHEIAADRPVVLVFYRGGWCPYCNTTLRAYADASRRIEAAGGVLIAVTPEQPGSARETVESNDLRILVAVDAGNRFAKTLGLVAAQPEELRPLFLEIGIDLPARNGDDSHELPLPATYVLSREGLVTFAHVDPDFTRRADPEDALAALERLEAGSVDRRKLPAGSAEGRPGDL